jgi:hypothetical protein
MQHDRTAEQFNNLENSVIQRWRTTEQRLPGGSWLLVKPLATTGRALQFRFIFQKTTLCDTDVSDMPGLRATIA